MFIHTEIGKRMPYNNAQRLKRLDLLELLTPRNQATLRILVIFDVPVHDISN